MDKNIENFVDMDKSLQDWIYNNKFCNDADNISCHNIYHIQRKSIDGNVIEEAFAANVFTNEGVNQLVRVGNFSGDDKDYILIGTGTTPPQVTDNSIEHFFAKTEVSKDYAYYPLTYNHDTGMISQYCRMYKASFPYNIDGIGSNTNITEIGYGRGNNGDTIKYLCSRALIKTNDGKNYIVKNTNEMLTISVYFSISIHESLITNAWNSGRYLLVGNFVNWFFNDDCRDIYISLKSLYNNISKNSSNATLASTNFYTFSSKNKIDETTNLLSNTFPIPAYTLENKRTPVHGTMFNVGAGPNSVSDSRTKWFSDIFLYIPEKLNTDEEITSYDTYTYSQKSPSLIYNFALNPYSDSNVRDGFKNHIPVYDFNIKSLYMYNHLTKEWDIPENFTNPYDIDYSEMYSFGGGNTKCLIKTPLGDIKNCFIYINNKAGQKSIDGKVKAPITSFDKTNVIIYASDKYWDTDSWSLISSPKNVKEDLQDKRYYIFVDLYDFRSYYFYNYTTKWTRTYYDTHKIITDETPYNIVPSLKISEVLKNNIYSQAMSNEENGWFVISDYLIYPNTTDGAKYYKLKASGDVSIDKDYGWDWGDRVIVRATGENSKSDVPVNKIYQQRYFRMYYTNNPDQLTEPTYIDIELNWSSACNVSELENCYSYSDHGWLVVWRKRSSAPEAIVINVYGDDNITPKQYTLPVEKPWMVHALNCSDYLVYCEYNTKEFHLFNMETKEDSVIFELDENVAIQGIGGWKDSIYVHVSRDGSYSTFYYSIEAKTLVELQTGQMEEFNVDPNSSNIYNISNEEVYVLITGRLTYPEYNNKRAKFITAEDPSIFYNLSEDDGESSTLSGSSVIRNPQLKYINNGKQLLLSFMDFTFDNRSGSPTSFSVVDIGKMIDDKKGITTYMYKRCNIENNSYDRYSVMVFWKNGIVKLRNNESDELWWYPIEYFLPHKMTGTTRTIQAYNNPKRLSDRTFSLTISNNVS